MTIGKPGIYIPFGVCFPLEQLPDAVAGRLLKELLEYGQWGVSGQIPDEAMALWQVLSSYILLDDLAYSCHCYKPRYRFYRKYKEQQGEVPLNFEDWMEAYGKYDQLDPGDRNANA